MARARNIKPSLFSNDELAEIEPLGRLLFIGLWTIADYKGDIVWREKRIKAQILPYDNCDIVKIAINLDKSGFIRFYSDGKNIYLNVTNFTKHQNPHKNEKQKGSDIPGYDEESRQVIDFNTITINHDKSGLIRNDYGTNRADSLNLIPDSLNLIPSKDTGNKNDFVDGELDGETKLVHTCPHKKIIEAYHEKLPMLPRIKDWSDGRRAKLKTRWSENKDRQNIEWWNGLFEYISKSDFLTGKKTDFKANLEWIVSPKNFIKIIEGHYDAE